MSLIKAKKDHSHFSDKCFKCNLDDNDILAVWVGRLSGLIVKEYLEPDYMCKTCFDSIEDKNNFID